MPSNWLIFHQENRRKRMMNANRNDRQLLSLQFMYLAKLFGMFVLLLECAIAAFPSSAEARVMPYLKVYG
jgi:hypothetical protein